MTGNSEDYDGVRPPRPKSVSVVAPDKRSSSRTDWVVVQQGTTLSLCHLEIPDQDYGQVGNRTRQERHRNPCTIKTGSEPLGGIVRRVFVEENITGSRTSVKIQGRCGVSQWVLSIESDRDGPEPLGSNTVPCDDSPKEDPLVRFAPPFLGRRESKREMSRLCRGEKTWGLMGTYRDLSFLSGWKRTELLWRNICRHQDRRSGPRIIQLVTSTRL